MVHLSYDLPTLDELKNFNPEQISKVISADGQVLHKLQAVKKREVIKIYAHTCVLICYVHYSPFGSVS